MFHSLEPEVWNFNKKFFVFFFLLFLFNLIICHFFLLRTMECKCQKLLLLLLFLLSFPDSIQQNFFLFFSFDNHYKYILSCRVCSVVYICSYSHCFWHGVSTYIYQNNSSGSYKFWSVVFLNIYNVYIYTSTDLFSVFFA